MRVLVTGAGGFIGRRLVDRLSMRDDIDELVLVDRRPGPGIVAGDLTDEAFLGDLLAVPFDSVFHLAATLTIDAERDPDVGWAANVGVPMRVLAAARAWPNTPKVVYVSSIAVFGGDLPDTVSDHHIRSPRTSYGTAKAIVELLLADHTRTGHVDGRALRLPIVVIRPGEPAPVVSDIVASIAREPLAGRPFVSPLGPDVAFPVVSVERAADGLVAVHDAPGEALGHDRTVNQPALTVTPAEMVDAVGRVAGAGAADLVGFEPDPTVEAVVEGWPTHFVSDATIGLRPDPDFDSILRSHLTHG